MHHLTVWQRQHWWFLRDRRKGSTRPRSLLMLQPLQPAFQCWKIYSDLHLKQSVKSFPNFPMPSNEIPGVEREKPKKSDGVVAGFVASIRRQVRRKPRPCCIRRGHRASQDLWASSGLTSPEQCKKNLWLIVYDCILWNMLVYDCVWLCMMVYDCVWL